LSLGGREKVYNSLTLNHREGNFIKHRIIITGEDYLRLELIYKAVGSKGGGLSPPIISICMSKTHTRTRKVRKQFRFILEPKY
jgi:hypothetical protein